MTKKLQFALLTSLAFTSTVVAAMQAYKPPTHSDKVESKPATKSNEYTIKSIVQIKYEKNEKIKEVNIFDEKQDKISIEKGAIQYKDLVFIILSRLNKKRINNSSIVSKLTVCNKDGVSQIDIEFNKQEVAFQFEKEFEKIQVTDDTIKTMHTLITPSEDQSDDTATIQKNLTT